MLYFSRCFVSMLACIGLSASSTIYAQSSTVSVSNYERVINTGNLYQKIEYVKELRRNWYEQSMVDLALSEFEVKQSASHQSLSQAELLYTILLGNFLLQARRNNFEVPESTLALIESLSLDVGLNSSREVVFENLLNISILDTNSSEKLLSEAIRSGDEVYLRAALSAYAQLCDAFEERRYEELYSELDSTRKEIADQIVPRLIEFKTRTRYCN